MNIFDAVRRSFHHIRRQLLSRSGRGLSAAAIWQLSNYAIPLLTFPYLARVLGAEGFGLIGLAAAIIGYAVMVTDWGLGLTGTQAVAQNQNDPAAIRLLVWDFIFAKALLGGICTGAVAIGIAWAPASLRPLLVVSMLNLVAAVLAVDWVLRGTEQLASLATLSIAGRLTSVPLTYLLVRNSDDLALAILATCLGAILSTALCWIKIARMGLVGLPVLRLGPALEALRSSTHIFLSTAVISLYTSSLIVVLGAVSSPVQVGLFTGARRLRDAVNGALSPFPVVFFPRMSAVSVSDPAGAERLAKRLFVVQGGFALVLSIALTVAAPILVRILLGTGFEQAVPVLRVMAWTIFLTAISNVAGVIIMIPFGMKRYLTYCLVLGAAIGLGTAIPLAYLYGAFGASIAALLAEIAVTTSMLFCLQQRFAWMPYARISSSPDPN